MNKLEALISNPGTQCIVCLGTGGVGKTTISAALGIAAAHAGRHSLVITIDPALRLLQLLGNEPGHEAVTPRAIGDRGGTIRSVHLDAAAVFDSSIHETLPTAQAAALIANPYYRILADAFAGSQDYMAIEFVGRLLEEEQGENPWDLLIIDTAPATSALDFLDAPNRLNGLSESRFVSLLRSSVAGKGSAAGLGQALLGVILGRTLASGIADLLDAANNTVTELQQRAARTLQHLRSKNTAFIVITRPAADQVAEAHVVAEQLRQRSLPADLLVVNQVPESVLPAAEATFGDDVIRATAIALEADATDHRSQMVADALRTMLSQQHQDEVRRTLLTELSNSFPAPTVWLPDRGVVIDEESLAALVSGGVTAQL